MLGTAEWHAEPVGKYNQFYPTRWYQSIISLLRKRMIELAHEIRPWMLYEGHSVFFVPDGFLRIDV